MRKKQRARSGEEVEMFSNVIEIMEAALQSNKMFPCRLPELSMFCKNKLGSMFPRRM